MSPTARHPEHERFAPTFVPSLAPLPTVPEVIVIGAGAAGIAAARALVDAGLSVAVLEARERVGGRAVTGRVCGHALDLGAHWLHAGPINPLVALGRARGELLRRAPQDSHLVVGRRFGRATEHTALDRAFAISERAIARAAAAPQDGAASSIATPGLGPWRARVDRVHALVSGRPLDELSLHDWPRMDYADNWFVAGGYGAYLARLAQGLPIALGTAVTRIDGSGPGVRVETADGASLQARAAIIALPIAVLQESVHFEPALPREMHEALGAFRTGIYEHAVLLWPSAPFRGRDRLASVVGSRLPPPGILTRIDGAPFHFLELDSGLARHIDGKADRHGAARRLARAVLAAHLGRPGLSVPVVTEWRHDPFARGSWAVIPPGQVGARTALQAPVAEKLWFAGEALSRGQWGTVGGAYADGRRAAAGVIERLRT